MQTWNSLFIIRVGLFSQHLFRSRLEWDISRFISYHLSYLSHLHSKCFSSFPLSTFNLPFKRHLKSYENCIPLSIFFKVALKSCLFSPLIHLNPLSCTKTVSFNQRWIYDMIHTLSLFPSAWNIFQLLHLSNIQIVTLISPCIYISIE